jgi:hypothetical protein
MTQGNTLKHSRAFAIVRGNMKTEATSVFGNFKWTASGNISDELIGLLLPFAITQVLQRSPSSNAEKAMAGYEKRPEGFKRDSIEFSDELAETLREHLESATVSVGEGKDAKQIPLGLSVSVEQYVPTAQESKFTEEKAIVARHEAAGDLRDWLKTRVGFKGDLEDEQAVLVAVREFKKAALKGL